MATDIGYGSAGVPRRRGGAVFAKHDLHAVLPRGGVLAVVLAVLIAMKVAALLFAMPLPDEGYYWLWGQHPGWSYYDHPPLGGWLHALTSFLFGDGIVPARLATLPTFAGTLAILWYWCGRLTPPFLRMRAFLTGVAIWLASPLMLVYQSLAIHDHLLIVFSLAALHFFVLFAESRDIGRPRYALLYLCAVALGFAALSKYNAVFVAAGLAVWILSRRDRARWLADKHLWLAALVTVAMLAPVIGWNWSHGWPSFRFYAHDRIGFEATTPGAHLYRFTMQSLLVVSPVLMFAMLRFLIRGAEGIGAALRGPAVAVFLTGTLAWYALCFVTPVAHYWNVTSYLLPLAIAPFLLRSAMEFRLHVLWGVLYGGSLLFTSTVMPVVTLTQPPGRHDENILFAAPAMLDELEAAEAEYAPDMLVTTDYLAASLLSLHGQRTDIVHLGPRRDMWDFWFDPAAHKGEDALVIAYDAFPETELIDTVFERTETVATFAVERFGTEIMRYRLIRAENYSGAGPQ
ncbi:ArnT family glycosyltransferase [Oricola indica]|jgi:4-amino-4-deoxy-L-arabinose transferase-like glycosyltransferase|uniref:ArnT family glycosyltransferase n=1 Tax=Oricola indica TaxID=2872591 RepID=UPI001CBC6182|nr:glycosyltransferase family 39 protein [Oricola indica]